MLELGWSLAVCSDRSPVVRPCDVLVDSRVNHRFYRKDMTWLHNSYCFIACIMRYIRSDVEQFSNTVATVSSIDRKSILFDELGNYVSDLSVHSARFANWYRFLKALISLGNKELAGLGNFSNEISLIEINVEAIFVDSNVKVDNVTVFQRSTVWNSVANYFINRSIFI